MDQHDRAFVERRLKRKALWIGLWLVRALALLEHLGGKMPRAWRGWVHATLNRLSRAAMCAIFDYAALRTLDALRANAARNRKRALRDPAAPPQSPSCRQYFGARLRKAFRGKTPQARLGAIRRVLDMQETHIARFAKRLMRGLTRLRSIQSRQTAQTIQSAKSARIDTALTEGLVVLAQPSNGRADTS